MGFFKLICINLFLNIVIFAQGTPNPPTIVEATGYNAGIKITWTKSTTTSVDRYYIYEDGNQIGYVSSTGANSYTFYHGESTVHVKHTYTVKAYVTDTGVFSTASNSSYDYSIRKFYVSQNGTGNGTAYNDPRIISAGNGELWETYDRYPFQSPTIGSEDGFYMGDTILFVGTDPFTTAITLPTSGTFPREVADMPDIPIFFIGAQAEPNTSGRPQPVFNGGGDTGTDAFQTRGCNYIYIGS